MVQFLVTGIKSYTARLIESSSNKRLDVFDRIKTKHDILSASQFNSNTGNYFIGEGALDVIGRTKAHYIDFGTLSRLLQSPDESNKIKSGFDALIFVTANLLRSDYDAGSEAAVFEEIGLPMIVLGIGCQRVKDLKGDLPIGTLKFVDYLKRIRATVFTRGNITREFLKEHGLSTVYAVGCPSLHRDPVKFIESIDAIKHLHIDGSSKVFFGGYLGTGDDTLDDLQLFEDIGLEYSYVLQDEHLYYGFELSGEPGDVVYEEAEGRISGAFSFSGSERLTKLKVRLFFNSDRWRTALSFQDASIGRRFHGVVAAYQAGIPGIMITVDDRMREMIELFQLPSIELHAWRSAANGVHLLNNFCKSYNADSCRERYEKVNAEFVMRTKELGFG